jgi:hypothetical protein
VSDVVEMGARDIKHTPTVSTNLYTKSGIATVNDRTLINAGHGPLPHR